MVRNRSEELPVDGVSRYVSGVRYMGFKHLPCATSMNVVFGLLYFVFACFVFILGGYDW